MLFSIALILISGLILGWTCKKIKLPALIGMLLAGIVFGPFCLNLLDSSILSISADIRKIALIIILTRAGLSLDVSFLKKIGRPALLMCFVPATFELLGMILIGPIFLGLSVLESAIMGSVLAAVSPAVVVPRMIKLMDEGYGTKKGVPQLILAGASVDDVFVIVLFSAFTGIAQGTKVSVLSFVNIPVSVTTGIALGYGLGFLLSKFFAKSKIQNTVKILIILSISFFMCWTEDLIKTFSPINFSALIGIMFLGIAIKKQDQNLAKELSGKYNQLWMGAEIFLFVLVGACVNINYLGKIGPVALLVIALALVFRMVGVFACMIKTKFNMKERFFSMMAYTPKATVQAAIGGVPLALGLSCGDTVLTVAVLAIVFTAPLGAFLIDRTYKNLLEKDSTLENF